MATFVKSQSTPPASSSGGGVRFVKPGEYQAPPMNIESPFWSMPPYGDGTAASLAATRPGQPDEKVGYGEIPKQLGRTGNELAATMTGTIPEFAGAVGAAAYDAARAPQTFPGMTAEQFQQMQQARSEQAPTPNPLAGAGAASREAFGLNLPELQPDPQLAPSETPYFGDAPIRNKFLRLQNELGGMVAPGVSIGAGTAMGGPLGGGAMAGTLFAAEKYQELKDAGVPDDKALRQSALFGGGSAALFAIPVVASAAKFLPPGLASRVAVVAASAAEMGGKGVALGGVDALSRMENIPQSEEEWRKGLEDVVAGVDNARSSFVSFAIMGGVGGLATPIGRAKAQAEAKAALDEFVDLGDATVRPRTEPSEQIGRSGNGVDVQRNAFGRDGGVRFQQGQRALPGPALPAPEPQGAITGPNGRPAIANPRATAPLADAPLFDPNRQVMPEAEVAALIDSLNQQLQARGQRIAVEPIGGAQGPLGLPPGAARGPMPEPPPAIPLPPPMGVGRPIEEAPSRRAVAETAPVPAGPAVRPPTPEELALEQQILGADLVDSREIPKPTTPETPKTAKEKVLALKEARKQSLIDTTVAQEAPAMPASPLQRPVEPQTPVEATQTTPEFSDMVKEAQRWRGAAMNVARSLEGNPREALKHSSKTTKGDLDKYLMNKFGVGPTEARDVSNELTRLNLPDDLTAQPEDFAGEPWAKSAPKPTAEFKGMQPRPRGQSPVPLYNIPDGKGGFTTVSAETAQAQGYDVPEPPKEAPTSIETAISAFNDAKRKSDALLDSKGDYQGEDYAKDLFAASGNVVNARDALVEQIVKEKPNVPIKGIGSNGNMITVTPSSKENGKWQITSHDDKGPIRDTLLDSYQQAVKEVLWDYRIQPESMEFREQTPRQILESKKQDLQDRREPDPATIRADIKALASATDRTRLADIREKLPQYDRATLDKELIAMQRDGELVLNRNDDPQDITARDEAAKLDLNGERRDLVYLTPQKPVKIYTEDGSIITKSARNPGKYQVTHFTDKGVPAGHEEYDTLFAAIKENPVKDPLMEMPKNGSDDIVRAAVELEDLGNTLGAYGYSSPNRPLGMMSSAGRLGTSTNIDNQRGVVFTDSALSREQMEANQLFPITKEARDAAIKEFVDAKYGPVDTPTPTPQKPTTQEKVQALKDRVEEKKAEMEAVYSPETQAIVDAYGGRDKALAVLNRQRDSLRGNEKVSPQTLAAIEELTGGKKTGQADMFGLGEIQKAPKADLPGQTRLPSSDVKLKAEETVEYITLPEDPELADFRNKVKELGVAPGGRLTFEDLGYATTIDKKTGKRVPGKNKPPWMRLTGKYTVDKWLEFAEEAGLISSAKKATVEDVKKLMSGSNEKRIQVSPDQGLYIPGFKGKAAEASSSIGDIMKDMGLTEEAPVKKPVKSIGFTSMFERKEAAGDKFVSSVMEQFGKTKAEAEYVLSYYLQNKLVKLDPVDGQFKLKHGAFWEQGPIDRAVEQPLKQAKGQAKVPASTAGTTSTPSSTKTQATVPRKVTVNKLLSLVPNDIVSYDSKKNTISFDASQEGITKVQQAMDKALDSVPQTPTAQAKYEEAYGEIMDAVFSKQEDAGTPSSKPKKSKKRGTDPTNPEAGVRLRMTSKDFRDGIKEIGRLLMAGAKSKPTIRFTKGLPEYVWDEAIKMHGLATSYTTRMQQAAADLIQGYRKSLGMQGLGKDIPKEMRELGTQYLEERSPAAKQALLRQFPEEMHAPLRRMRALIDEMTEEWIRNDVVSPAKAQTLKANKGAYVTRQYQTFNDPNYSNVIPSLVRERMRGLLRQWYPEIKNDDVLEGLVNEWVDVSEGEGSGLMWRGSPLGARNFDILKKRENWPQEVLDLWGLEKDVIKNALNTAVKQAKPLAATIFQHNVVKHGRENNYLFSREDIADINSGKAPKAKAEAYGRLVANNNGTWMTEAAESNKPGASPYASLGVLGDMYASKDFKKAMHDAMNPTQHVEAIKALIQLNGIAKQALTIESLTTQATNFITNPGFFMGSGLALYDMPGLPGRMKIAAGITMTELKNTSAKSYRDVANRAIQLGVIKEMDNASDISKVVEEGKGGPLSKPAIKLAQAGQRLAHEQKNKAKLALGKAAQLPKYLQDMAAEGRDELVAFYQAGDDFWKALSWLTDTEYQMERNPSLSRAQAEELSAKMIRTYGVPYYSELPSVIQKTRHIPVFNPFGSFPTEAPRILFNQTMQAKGEAFSGNAAETKMAARRFAGQAMAYGIPILTATVSAAMWALSDKDQDTLNDMGPQWDSNSNKAYYAVDRSKGIVKYWNISRASVQSEITDPINALLREEKLSEGTQRALLAVLDPYLQEEIGWKALRQIFENRDDYGRPIWNDADTKSEFAKKIGGVAMGAVQPGTVDSIYRILKDETPVTKLLAEATGQRIRTVDMPKELTYKAKEFMASTRDASMDVKRAEKSGDNAELAEQKRQRLDYHKQQWESLHDKVSGMKAFGVDTIRIMDALKKGGMSQKNINNLMYGIYVPPESMQ